MVNIWFIRFISYFYINNRKIDEQGRQKNANAVGYKCMYLMFGIDCMVIL
jgi:hypothetical protein